MDRSRPSKKNVTLGLLVATTLMELPPLVPRSSRVQRVTVNRDRLTQYMNILPLSAAVRAFAFLLAAGHATAQSIHVAYEIPAEQQGNQAFDGALGMDFDVDNTVIIKKLGCFDDSSDGLFRPIAVRLYDRDTLEVVASIDFLPDDAGTAEREDGVLVGGSRFLALPAPLTLSTGFRGTIVAEGYGPEERNGNRNPPLPWTQDQGLGSLRFVGGARYNFPVSPGAYPETVDGGPSARYAAGTFEYQTTAPELPGIPVVTVVPGKASVELSWPPVTVPLAAATYRILRSTAPDGVFAQIAEIPGTQYIDAAVTNDTLFCYKVIGVSSNGRVGPESILQCGQPVDLGASTWVAYDTPWGVAGNQAFGGSLGMDFDVTNPIIIRQLGCFDDMSDGLFAPITVRLFNRDTEEIVAEHLFVPDDAGTAEREDGRLIGGMRFASLPEPITLPMGFRGTIQADGYGAMERNANRSAPTPWTTRDGAGSIDFVGVSRFGEAGQFPGSVDAGPAARYGAGTFIYESTPPLSPGKPVARLARAKENHAATLVWEAVLLPLPAVRYEVWRADSVDGQFLLIGETAGLTYRDTDLPNGVEKCYSVRGIAAGGQVGPESVVLCTVPTPRTGGIAYGVPAGTFGNQSFGGALGMHFDVEAPVEVTRLGVFDSGSDGLFRSLAVRLYNRDTLEVVAALAFAPDDEGELVEGSRFKDLAVPLVLPSGFRGSIVASGYGEGEPNGNVGALDLGLTQQDGACLRFTGSSSFGLDPDGYADQPDGGPSNRYAAGTFAFAPVTPEGKLTIAPAVGGVAIGWTAPEAALEQSDSLAPGSWQLVPKATPGMIVPATEARRFFRLSW